MFRGVGGGLFLRRSALFTGALWLIGPGSIPQALTLTLPGIEVPALTCLLLRHTHCVSCLYTLAFCGPHHDPSMPPLSPHVLVPGYNCLQSIHLCQLHTAYQMV
jgi:hypothetical protein